jgi:DNA-binding protein HU-beta
MRIKMNKSEFVNYISEKHSCTKIEAEKVIDMFVSSVIDALGAGNEISLVGFGSFSVSKVAARTGRNPRTGESLKIAAYNQPKFKVGQKLKDAVNPK